MSIGTHMAERLRRLTQGDQSVLDIEDAQRIVVGDQSVRAALAFFEHDRFSITLRELVVDAGEAPVDHVQSYLSTTAAVIARELNFLEEPLAVWEMDSGERTAQLRSAPPLRDGDEVFYWEVTLTATTQPAARIMRYHWAPGMVERELVAYPATFALVARMADSLATALMPMSE